MGSVNLTSPAQVKQLLQEMDFRPSRVLGQNFLIDRNTLNILLHHADLDKTDAVLEIGPGLGVLTEALLPRVGTLFAVEKDDRLYQHLEETLNSPNLDLRHTDIMDLDLQELQRNGLNKVVANLPYSVGTRALVDLSNLYQPPMLMAVTVQKDVAERLAATPGTKAYGTVSVLLQSRYEVSLVKTIAPTCFYPRPKIQSGIVVCVKREAPLDARVERQVFLQFVKHVFLERRKQIGGILHRKKGLDQAVVQEELKSVGIQPDQRPETLTVEQWCRLAERLG